MKQSVDLLNKLINQSGGVYGVTTGFGGSADTVTNKLKKLQTSLISFLNVGFNTLLDDEIVRGMMCLRMNTLLKGNSACSFNIVNNIGQLLNSNILPEVPERGSISASGDLIPLSYLGGLLTGKEGIFAKVNGKTTTSKEALNSINL